MQQSPWEVEFFTDFMPEFQSFSSDVQDELLAAIEVLKALGPHAGRPYVGSLRNPVHPNMKELRFHANKGAEIWRAAFAFVPERRAIVLIAAQKQGMSEARFYKNLLRKANQRYDNYLRQISAKHRSEP